MTIRIGSNISALRTIRALEGSQDQLVRTLERLSSGARINRASDDPAGLSVSSILTNKARVLGRARLNVSDAFSLLSIADSSLNQMSNMLSRMAELAEQAANGSLAFSQRQNLYREYNALEQEIRRIGETTNFNGINSLRGQSGNRGLETILSVEAQLSIQDISQDGRYVGITYESGGDSIMSVLDTETGQEKIVTEGVTPVFMQVLANGDAIYTTYDTNLDVSRFTFSSGETEFLARINSNIGEIGYAQTISVSQDGRYAVFASRYAYQDGSLGSVVPGDSGTYEYFRLDLNDGRVHAIPSSSTGSPDASYVSADGRYAAISDGFNYSICDLENLNAKVTPVTFATAGFSIAGLTNAGELIFSSTSNITGDNPNGYRQFFATKAGTGATRQLSDFNASYILASAKANFDGSTIFFRSTGDITGQNPSAAHQLFAFDTHSGTIVQRSSTAYTEVLATSIKFSDDGSYIYGSDAGRTTLYRADVTPYASTQDFEVGFGSTGRIAVELDSLLSAIRGLSATVLTSAFGARMALDEVRENIERVSALRGKIGAAQSRISIAGSLVDSQREEITAAAGRIRDADVADESSRLTRQTILQQVGAAVLAQANQQPALALTLLGNTRARNG